MKKAVGYIRVSTEEQAVSGLGLEAQKSAIGEYCAAEGIELVEIFEDPGVTGATDVDKRDGLLSALRELERVDVLVVSKIDRIGRDMFVLATVDRLVERAGAKLLCADGNGNASTPEAALMRNIVAAFAVYERALIRCRTKAALAAKKDRGEAVGALMFGETMKDGRRVVDEDEARVVGLIHELADQGLSRRAIAVELNTRGLTTKRGSTWTHVQIGNILRRFEEVA